MDRHEPCNEHEIFLCNIFLGSNNPLAWYQNNGIRTCRLGSVAFDIRGHRLPGYAPLFIDKTELPLHQRLRANQLEEVVNGTRDSSGNLKR
jgi:hypothetical protein